MSAGYMRRCAGKTRHEDEAGAGGEKASLTSAKRLDQGRLGVYLCDQCLGWHVGGSDNKMRTRRRRSGKRPNKRLRGRV